MKKVILLLIVLVGIISLNTVKMSAFILDNESYTVVNSEPLDYYWLELRFQIVSESTMCQINIPNLVSTVLTNSYGTRAKIQLYDSFLDEYFEFYWSDYIASYLYGIHTIYWEELGVKARTDSGAISEFVLIIPQNWVNNTPPANLETDCEAFSYVIWDEMFKKVVYMDGLTVYTDSLFTDIPDEPTSPTKTGYAFIGWYKADGTRYNFNVPPTSEELLLDSEVDFSGFAPGYQFWLYARYVATTGLDIDYDDPVTNLPTGLSDFLTQVGFNNASGFIVIYVILCLAIIIFMVLLKLPALAIIIGIISITGVFIYLGLLPIWFILIVSLIIITVFFWSIKGGEYE